MSDPPSLLPSYPVEAAMPPSSSVATSFLTESTLSKLSPEQLEKALFTPRNPPPSARANAPKDSSADGLISCLTKRVEQQESRLQELENQLRDHHRSCQAQSSDGTCSPAKRDARPVEPSTDLLCVDAEDTVSEALVPTNLQILSEVYSSPSSASTPSASLDPMATSAEDLSYRADSLEAFEWHLNSSRHADTMSATPRTYIDGSWETLLEGVGTAAELTLHREDSEAFQNGITDNTGVRVSPQEWDGTISWKTTSTFDNRHEETKAVPHKHWSVSVSEHGLVFTPSEWDDNVYRTVILTNLPLNIKMKTLFKGLLGGDVYSAHLMNMERAAGFHMAIVTFVHEKAASAYAEFAARNGVYFNNQRAKVTRLSTATYPMATEIEKKIFTEGYTRCLSIRGPSDPARYAQIVNHIWSRFPMYFDLGDRVLTNETDTEVIVRLNSIPAAHAIMLSLQSASSLFGWDVDFAADPCAHPLPHS